MLSYLVPHAKVPHAGGGYLRDVCRSGDRDVDLTVVAPTTTVNVEAVRSPGSPARVVLVAGPGRHLVHRLVNRLALVIDRIWRRVDAGVPYLPWAAGILTSPEARRAIREADVLDLQWLDAIRLLPLLRLLNQRARAVGTYHDVQSQSFAREAGGAARNRTYWALQSRLARWHERRGVRRLDSVVAFSQKDLDLLGDPPSGVIVNPPLARGDVVSHPVPDGPPTVVFVSYLARDENDKAAQWLLAEIWPLVRREVPEARLRLVGSGASAIVTERAARDPSVTVTGFVDDLDEEYRQAWVAVIPLRQGAGVKFKAIESLFAGVPTVTTTVGAEGIGGEDLFVRVSDDPAVLACAAAGVLTDPYAALAGMAEVQRRVAAGYGLGVFEERLRELWRTSIPKVRP